MLCLSVSLISPNFLILITLRATNHLQLGLGACEHAAAAARRPGTRRPVQAAAGPRSQSSAAAAMSKDPMQWGGAQASSSESSGYVQCTQAQSELEALLFGPASAMSSQKENLKPPPLPQRQQKAGGLSKQQLSAPAPRRRAKAPPKSSQAPVPLRSSRRRRTTRGQVPQRYRRTTGNCTAMPAFPEFMPRIDFMLELSSAEMKKWAPSPGPRPTSLQPTSTGFVVD